MTFATTLIPHFPSPLNTLQGRPSPITAITQPLSLPLPCPPLPLSPFTPLPSFSFPPFPYSPCPSPLPCPSFLSFLPLEVGPLNAVRGRCKLPQRVNIDWTPLTRWSRRTRYLVLCLVATYKLVNSYLAPLWTMVVQRPHAAS